MLPLETDRNKIGKVSCTPDSGGFSNKMKHHKGANPQRNYTLAIINLLGIVQQMDISH